jgi:hypothetical protein
LNIGGTGGEWERKYEKGPAIGMEKGSSALHWGRAPEEVEARQNQGEHGMGGRKGEYRGMIEGLWR